MCYNDSGNHSYNDCTMEVFERCLINNVKYGGKIERGETYDEGIYDTKICVTKRHIWALFECSLLLTQIDAESDKVVTTNMPAEKNF